MFNLKSTSLSNFALTSSRLSKNIFAVITGNDRLGMAENNICITATSTLNIHKIRVRGRNQSFEFMGLSLVFYCWVKKICVHLWNVNINN